MSNAGSNQGSRASVVDGMIAAILLVVSVATFVPGGSGQELDFQEAERLLDRELIRAKLEIEQIQRDSERERRSSSRPAK